MRPELRGCLHRPEKIIGRMWQGGRFVDPQGESDQPKVLRETLEYKDFLFHFAKFGAEKEKFKNESGSRLFSEISYVNAEAFIVCVYTFNYNQWRKKFKKEAARVEGAECFDWSDGGEAECQETEEGLQRKRQKTADCGGWSETAFTLFYAVGDLIGEQRKTEQSKALEGELMEQWRKKGGSHGAGTKRGQEQRSELLEIWEAKQRDRMKEESMQFMNELGANEQDFRSIGGGGGSDINSFTPI
jgi:hypothetical protein